MAYPTSGGRTSYVGTENVGDVLTKANFDKGPGGLCGYTQITANTSALAGGTVQTIMTTSFTAGAQRMYRITVGIWGIVTVASGGETTELMIWEMNGPSTLVSVAITNGQTTGNYPGKSISAWHQPSAGTVTYAMRVLSTPSAGSSTVTVWANPSGSTNRNAYIMAEDVGPAF